MFLFPFVSATDIAFHGKSTLRKTNKLSNYKFLAGPVFKADAKHWTLLFVDVKKKTFYYFDSLYSCQQNSFSIDVFNNFCDFCSGFSDLCEIKWINGSLSKNITQNDSFSCGLSLCYFFECLFKADILSLKITFDLNQYRIKINDTLSKLC